MKHDLPPKLFFRIGEVAGLVGVEPHVLRYWEREFRSIRPTKSAKGQRVYSRKDVENLLRVRDLLYRDGFTIAGAKKKLHAGPAAERSFDDEPAAPVSVATQSRADASPAQSPHFAQEASAGFGAEPHPEEDFEAAVETQSTPQVALATIAAPDSPRSQRDKLVALRDEVEAYLEELSRR